MTRNLICAALNTVELTENPAPSLIWCITRSRTCGALLFRLFSTSPDFTQLDFTPLDSGSASVFIAFFLRNHHYPRNSDLDLFYWYKSSLIETISRCVTVPHFYRHQWHTNFTAINGICAVERVTLWFDNAMNIDSRLDCVW